MDARKAYGTVTALGTSVGEKAKQNAGILAAIRQTPDRAAFVELLRLHATPAKLVEAFAAFLTEEDWKIWRSRLLLQAKMVQQGGKPAPGHERSGP